MNSSSIFAVMGQTHERDHASHYIPHRLVNWQVCWRGTRAEAEAVRKRCGLEADAYFRWFRRELADGGEDRDDWDQRLQRRRSRMLDLRYVYSEISETTYLVWEFPDSPQQELEDQSAAL